KPLFKRFAIAWVWWLLALFYLPRDHLGHCSSVSARIRAIVTYRSGCTELAGRFRCPVGRWDPVTHEEDRSLIDHMIAEPTTCPPIRSPRTGSTSASTISTTRTATAASTVARCWRARG